MNKPKVEIIGDVEIAAKYLDWAKRQWANKTGRWVSATDDCIISFSNWDGIGDIKFIVQTTAGFITTPRTGIVKQVALKDTITGDILTDVNNPRPVVSGGWRLSKEDILTPTNIESVFPLVDGDSTSALVSTDFSDVAFLDQGDYGNAYAINDVDNTDIISWFSIPNRHAGIALQGFSPPLGDLSSYYANTLYKKGVVVSVAPLDNLIIGAGFVNGMLHVVTVKGDSLYLWAVETADFDGTSAGWMLIRGFINKSNTLPFWLIQDREKWSFISSDGAQISQFEHIPSPTFLAKTAIGSSALAFKTTSLPYNIFYEGIASSALTVTGSSIQNTDGFSNTTFGTDLNWYVQAPDTVIISRDGNTFCAAMSRFDGKEFSIGACTYSITWSGPVTPIANSMCATLDSVCYPPGSYNVNITATIIFENLQIQGSTVLEVVGKAGYWGPASACSLSIIQRSKSVQPSSPCYIGGSFSGYSSVNCVETINDRSADYCTSYLASLPPALTGEVVIAGNTKLQYIKFGSSKITITQGPECSLCFGGSFETNAPYENIKGESISTATSYFTTRVDQYCTGAVNGCYASGGTDGSIVKWTTVTQETRSGTNVRAGYLSYKWVCA